MQETSFEETEVLHVVLETLFDKTDEAVVLDGIVPC